MLKATLIIWLIVGGQVTRPVVVGNYYTMDTCEVAAEQFRKETGANATCLTAY